VRVINYQDIRTFTGHGTPHTDSEVVTSLVCVPSTGCFTVSLQSYTRKNALIDLRIHQISHFSTKTDR
jgi:hypothetical protein